MFRVKMLFSTVSISNSNYCFNIFTLPGNWAMLEKKAAYLITFSGALLAGSCERGEQGTESAHSTPPPPTPAQPTANKQGWGGGNLRRHR